MTKRKFLLLLWKSYCFRRYQWKSTLAVVIIPLVITYLYIYLVGYLLKGERILRPATFYPPMDQKNLTLVLGFQRILYAPANKFTDKFMKDLTENLVIKPGLQPFPNEAEVFLYLSKNGSAKHEKAVIFYDLASTEIPDKLNYSIRDLNTWNTDRLFVNPQEIVSSLKDLYSLQNFISLQMVINEGFIRLKTNKNNSNKVKVWFQPCPYPEYYDESNSTVGNLRGNVLDTTGGLFMIIMFIIIIPVLGEIMSEKEDGLKELMKLAGVNEWMIWSTWFLNVFIISMLPVTIALTFLIFPIGIPAKLIRHIPFAILWIVLVVYCVTNIFYCFLFAAIFHKGSVATSICMMVLLLGMFSDAFFQSSKLKNLQFLIPIVPFLYSFHYLSIYELETSKFEWKTFSQPIKHDLDREGTSIMFFIFCLIFDAVFYALLTLYVIRINPGPFGIPKSPFFMDTFQRFFLPKKSKSQLKNLNDGEKSEFIEKTPTTLQATLRIRDLYKYFGETVAVNGVNLDVFKGEILALLGHNGAGKTTTLSVLTGLTAPSKGSIVFREMDVFQNMDEFRSYLGICLQENRLFSYLTVMDQLVFFGMLKGATLKETRVEALEYLKMMDLEEKKNSYIEQLSGGMKRKMCLAVALMGKAEVLILDEPTSGMDVQTRRNLWDLLLGLRENRTIIITTHYMEEADALGDRIAIMQSGNILCYGTPIFLKKAYGTGYKLTITKASSDISRMTETVTSIIPGSTLDNETQTEIVYDLPLTETSRFPNLFKNLESNKSKLGIGSIGVSCTTMEHVFLKAGGIPVQNFKRSTDVNKASRDSSLRRTTGLSLYVQQMITLSTNRALAMIRNFVFVVFKFAVPTLFLLFFLWILKMGDKPKSAPLALTLNAYPNSKIVCKADNKSEIIAKAYEDEVVSHGSKIIRSNDTNDIILDLLNVGRKKLHDYNIEYVTSAQFNATDHTVLFNLKALHSFPIAVATYYNALLRSIFGNDSVSIYTINHPVESSKKNEEICKPPDGLILISVGWFFALGFYTYDILSQLIEFRNKERTNGFKHILMISHVSALVYWLTAFISDFLLYTIVLFIRMLLFKIFDQYGFLSFDENLKIVILFCVIGGASILLFLYVLSYVFDIEGGMSVGVNIIMAMITLLYFFADTFFPKPPVDSWWAFLLEFAKRLIMVTPPMNFFLCFIKIIQIWKHNLICLYCPSELQKYCLEKNPKYHYLVFPTKDNPAGLNLELCLLIFDIFLYSLILGLFEVGAIGYEFNQWKKGIFGTYKTVADEGDDDVKKEFDRVQGIKSNESDSKSVSLLVDGLRKNYITWFRPFTAVADVTFAVERGECFGLLGVNGAGKTTTFKMLTAEIWPTLGDAAIEGIKLSTHKLQYLSMAGYCAQTNCFVEELTSWEMLSMIAKLRGVSDVDLTNTVNKWISTVGLEKYQNKPCGKYSGGNKRKTCTAMALIGDPRVVFLDEPTSGVDPVSRRKLYDVMNQTRVLGQSLILTSHSMDECETLCDRISIMAKGVMKCLGTVQRLKTRYAQGFSLMIKLNDDVVNEANVGDLKNNMNKVFNAKDITLKDEHKGALYYQLKDVTLLWSTLFERMELMKNQHKEIVEDYVLTDTTLEEVFISFTQP